MSDKAKRGQGVIALDLGVNTGWAWASQNEMQYGLTRFPAKPGEHQGHRFRRFANIIGTTLPATVPDGVQAVYFEDVMFHASQGARHMYFGFRGVVEMYCAKYGWQCCPISVPQWQKHLTGSGKPGKERILADIIGLGYRVDSRNQDAADAIGILKFALETDYKTPLSRFIDTGKAGA